MADIPVRVILEAIDNASDKVGGVAKSLGKLTTEQKVFAAGMVALGTSTILLGKQFIGAAGQMEQWNVAFSTMLGSSTKAQELLGQLSDFAKKTPFNLPQVIEGSQRLLAYNVSAKNIIPTFTMLGNIAAGVGKDKLPQLILAFGQVQAATKLTGAELRQFSEAGVPLLQTLADQAGVSAATMVQRISDGLVKASDVNKALESMQKEGGKFFNLMDKQSTTTSGKLSNFEDGIFRLKVSLGNALLPALNKILDTVVPLLEKFSVWAGENPKLVAGLMTLGVVFGAIGAAMLTFGPIIMGIAGAIQTFGGVISAAITVITAIVGVLGGPITLILLALAAVIGFVAIAWKKNWFDIQGKTAAVIEAIKGFITGLVEKFNAFVAFIVNIPAMVQGAWEAFKTMLAKFFIEDIPYAIGWLVGRFVRFVTEDVPNFITGVINWFATLPGKIEAWLKDLGQKIHDRWEQFKKDAIEKTVAMVDGVVAWIGKLPKQIDDFVKQIPKTIEEWFNKAKDIAIKIAMDLFYGVSGWIGQVIKLFAGIIDKANEAIDKSNKAMSLGMKSGSGQRQFGGPVSSASPVLVGERGPEMFVPQTAGRIIPNNQISGTKSGATIQFIINANTIVNSPTERRSLAEALYKDLVSLARAQNRTVAEVFGG